MDFRLRKYIFYIGFPILSLLLIGLAFAMRDENEQGSDQSVQGVAEASKEPQVISVHPAYAVEGEIFEYTLRINDPDTRVENITARIAEGPDWIFFKEKFTLGGVPKLGDNNVEKIVIEINDGHNLVREEFYLLIKENENTLPQ